MNRDLLIVNVEKLEKSLVQAEIPMRVSEFVLMRALLVVAVRVDDPRAHVVDGEVRRGAARVGAGGCGWVRRVSAADV